ncbi:E3 ubiquitin-protein ligase UBR2 isoform X2 [Lingula anatina]|uniref:E3 ubiquitin-protein ligase n=1 Tax=Lingula anatina TaxID=7574 RepID=A0A1S3KDX9_LINAN|nr:E3 ubiquitin-protein ligase UBR2 isoform X2 [Lingula anatina]|eukprot:XP_013420461.1 E3 ubiquitin-protein ligase UBR2 isoform X2 [Lingula anatina]
MSLTVSGAKSIAEFNPSQVIQSFQEAYEEGCITDKLRQHFCQFVPLVYGLLGEYDPNREERKAKKLLFNPVEAFLCGGPPDAVFKELKEKDHPPILCGRVFRSGEPTYSCRDCAVDPTCVLCIDCFNNGAHRKHKYRMSTSSGGGYCDCGDKEAWKTDPLCEIHRKGEEKGSNQNPIDNLPADLRQRAEAVLSFVIKYAVQMLLWTQYDDLPPDLRPPEMGNTYCTMLFNDEIHTYEQVINTLTRAIECTKKEAVDFATTVDREGRSSVKNGSFTDCEEVRRYVERNTTRQGQSKALKCHVMHLSVVAHQIFAQRMLTWLLRLIGQSDGLRQLFCKVSMEPSEELDGQCLLEKIMLADTQLWKAARVQSHQLFMAGVLMDQEYKKKFAVLFTQHYPKLIWNFVEDDHDHSVSVVSLTVQIYTVFTMARMLITEHDLLSVILKTFLEECESKKDRDGKFTFDRSERSQQFKRAQYVLYDLKYGLNCKPSPEEWNDDLRRNFLNGFQCMLNLLSAMQGMDAVQRQTGQHLEFEPEWEGAFNLQIKLEDNIQLMQEWCATDKSVLIEAYRKVMETLEKQKQPRRKTEKVSVCGHKVECTKYDVSSQKVSIHLPLSRMLAGLHVYLEKYRLTFSSPELLFEPKLSMVDLIELPLRAQVLVAQTQASMWRRNGFSLLNQIYFYLNVRCRTQMYDKDIIMLQAGASSIDSNHFIVHVMNKFGLLQWVKDEYDTPGGGNTGTQDDTVRYTITLAEEFLNLLIIILSERYCQGIGEVSKDEGIQRELIHQLCLKPMAHSELEKAMPEDANHETGIEENVHKVADFSKKSDSGKGLYELKPEFYKDYSPFFYHYTKAEQSKSEEEQRKRKKQAGEDQALPPPVPPPFTAAFQPCVNLLQCDVMLHIMKTVLHRTAATWSRSWSEAQLERVLHLIGLALHEDRRAHDRGEESFNFVEKAMKGNENSLHSTLESLVGHQNISHDTQKDLLSWTLKTFAEVRALKDESASSEAVDIATKTTAVIDEREQQEKKRKEIAAKRRARIMAQMSAMQKNFIQENAELFESTSTELKAAVSDMDISEPVAVESPVCLGPSRSSSMAAAAITHTCILCQEEQEVGQGERALVLAVFVQRSSVLSKNRGKRVEDTDEYDPLFMPPDLFCGAYTSTCGHVMHSDCWQSFFDSVLAKERRRILRFRHRLSYHIERGEFLCPLCETISNTVIPIIPPLQTLVREGSTTAIHLSLGDWIDGLQKTVRASIKAIKEKESEEERLLYTPCPLSSITKMMTESVARNFNLLFEYITDDGSNYFSESISQMLKKFSRDTYAIGLGVLPDDSNDRIPQMPWSTLAFTIQAIDNCLREDSKPLFGSLSSRQLDCLNALVKVACVSGQVTQPEVVKQNCVRLLSGLILQSTEKKPWSHPCLLEIDMFHYMVKACVSMPILYSENNTPTVCSLSTAGLNDLHLLELVLTAHMVQIILSADFQIVEPMELELEGDTEEASLLRMYNDVRAKAGLDTELSPFPWHLNSHIKEACLPFLRCAAIFFHLVSAVSPPSALYEVGGDEFECICKYLCLPTSVNAILGQYLPVLDSLITSWCTDQCVQDHLSESPSTLVTYPRVDYQLVKLPVDFSDLINKVSTFNCPNSDSDESRAPTMCLVCGQLLCSQSYCCQVTRDGQTIGAATEHTETCGAGVGIFLRVRDCQVLLMAGKSSLRGCFYPPPYLDEYGETDQGLRRGNPLQLSHESYEKIQRMWLNHTIPEEIAHTLETNSNLLSFQWENL